MRNILFLIGLISAVAALAHTDEESFQMVKLMRYTMYTSSDWEDCIDESNTNGVPVEYPTALSLFESLSNNTVFSSWSIGERQNAFNSFLLGVAHTNRSQVGAEYCDAGDFALGFSQEKKFTNIVVAVKEIIRAPFAPCKDEALLTLPKLERPSIENNRIIFHSIMDKRGFSRDARCDVAHEYTEALKFLSADNRFIVTNAANLVYLNRHHLDNYTVLDKFLGFVYPDYDLSTNRYIFSRAALLQHNLNDFERGYFVSVTNTLHSAGEPLASVPEL